MRGRPVFLIGGAPTTGKSTVAQALAKHLDLPWISTDQIRDVMRVVASRSDYPKLFNPEGYDAERFHSEFSAEQTVAIEFEQAEAAWLGIRKLISDDYTWTKGFVIEGVNILPRLVAADFATDTDTKAVFLIDEDADRIREVIFTRGLWDDAEKYPDAVKEKEVAWVTLFSQRLKAEALAAGYPAVEVQKDEQDLPKVLTALGLD